MNEFETFHGIAGLVRKVAQVARSAGYDGDLYDDEQRQWRDPSHEERCAFFDIFRPIASYYVLTGDCREFVKRLIWNGVMNSSQSKRDLSI